MLQIIEPSWPANSKIRAYNTTRNGGFSKPPYENFNLGLSVGDDEETVQRNRQILLQKLQLPNEPIWLKQVHGTEVLELKTAHDINYFTADASFSFEPQVVCTVMTADCLPIFLCDEKAQFVAAIHAGWKGLLAGIIEATIEKITQRLSGLSLNPKPNEWLVWFGPAISQKAFEVGDEVFQQFTALDKNAALAFLPHKQGKWLADLYLLARQRLQKYSIERIYGSNFCTFTEEERFFSYRRDGQKSGRMASVIWLEK